MFEHEEFSHHGKISHSHRHAKHCWNGILTRTAIGITNKMEKMKKTERNRTKRVEITINNQMVEKFECLL
jgi:hypothetical protein